MRISLVSVLALGVAAFTSTGAAFAADVPSYSAPSTYSAPAYSDAGVTLAGDRWTGFYAGAHLGGITSNDFNESNSAVTGGLQAGYLQQFDMFVVGAELQGTLSDDLNYTLVPGAGITEDWSIAAKGRAGVALDSTLIYGTAGVNFASLEGNGGTARARDTHAGFAFGGGVEQALTDNVSIRAEYLQTRYWDVNSSIGGVGRSDDLTSHSVTVGVNYKF